MAGSRRADPELRWLPWVIVAGVVAVAVLGFFLTRGAVTTEDANAALKGDKVVLEEQRDATVEQATTLADQVAAACSAGGVTADELFRVGACQQAQQVRAEPIPGPRGAPGPGPTPEQLRAAVAAYLAENPPPAGRAPTAGEVAAAVTEYLTAHPPEPGRAPTAGEIAAAVETYFATNPVRNGVDGVKGQDGGPGRPPTAEEIQAAVDQHLAQNPPQRGPAGPTCPDGTTLLPVEYADNTAGVGCVLNDQPVESQPSTPPAVPDEDEDSPGG